MKNTCPAPELLMEVALAGDAGADFSGHVRACAVCCAELLQLRTTASAVRLARPVPVGDAADCLDDAAVAAVLDGALTNDVTISHLASCARCRSRVSAVQRVLRSDAVMSQLPSRAESTRRRRFLLPAATATLVAAALAVVLLRPAGTMRPMAGPDGDRLHRESALTTTVAPRLLGPAQLASATDLLVWTSVPHADRYQVKVFDRAGTLMVDQPTTDTTFVIPAHLGRAQPTVYLWKVEARTGWDRWVASEWKEFTLDLQRKPQ